MQVREQTTVFIGDNTYLITALEATYGLDVLNQVQKMALTGDSPSSAFVKEVIMKSVTVNNLQMNEKLFNTHFSKKYKEMFELFEKIIAFNFGEEDGPNQDSGISD